MSKTGSIQNSTKYLNKGKNSMPKINQASFVKHAPDTIIEEDEGVPHSGQNIKFPLIK